MSRRMGRGLAKMKSLVAGGALLASSALSVSALDLCSGFQHLAPSSVQARYKWSGIYGRSSSWSVPYDSLIAGAPVASGTTSPRSALCGSQFGYNYQNGPFVPGIEGHFTRRYGMNSALLAPPGLEGLSLREE